MSKLIIRAHFYKGSIFFEDHDLLAAYKLTLKDSDELTVTFEPRQDYRSEGMVNLFNVAYERWAKEQDYDRKWARDFMKWRHGKKWLINPVAFQASIQAIADKPGGFFEHEDAIYFLLSTNVYSKAEMHVLIEGTLRDMEEAQVDTSDLRQELRIGG